MNEVESVLKISKDELVAFFREQFVAIDDIPEDTAQRDRIIMEARASLLIEANCTSERFPAFMKCGYYTPSEWKYPQAPQPSAGGVSPHRSPSGWTYPLVPPFTRNLNHTFPSQATPETIEWHFDELEISGERTGTESRDEPLERWKLKISYDNSNPPIPYLNQYIRPQLPGIASSIFNELRSDFERVKQDFEEQYRLKFRLCAEISPYKTPEAACRFWGSPGEPFAVLKSGGLRPDQFHHGSYSRALFIPTPGETEAETVQRALWLLTAGSIQEKALPEFRSKYYEDWLCMIFPFRNPYGEEVMQLIKLYDPKSQAKILLPVTSWMRNSSILNQLFCVPLPEDKQPLYQLDLILAPECETVILTDSVELADANQRQAPAGVVFTSFIGVPGRYDQVDWTPLRQRNVTLLIVNHSGMTSEAAVLKMRELADYLEEKEQDITVNYLFLEVNYPGAKRQRRRGDFQSVEDLLERYRQNQPEIVADSIHLMESSEEFEALCLQAEASIASHPLSWWADQNNPEQLRIVEEQTRSAREIDFIMHPLLIKGEATILYAGKSMGKSSLCYSIAGRVVAANGSSRPAPLLAEKWWSVANRNKHKVLYLDFENQNRIETLKNDFLRPYLPKEGGKECENDVIIKDMSQISEDFSQPANHQKIMDMIAEAKQQGTPGVPVDLLIIDTYSSLVKTENPSTPDGFKQLFNKLRGMGMAILVTTHANSKSEVRGFQSKLDIFYFKLRLFRENGKPDDLGSPFTVEYEEMRGSMGSRQRVPFQVQYSNTDRRWQVFQPERTENEELKLIVDDFKRCGYSRSAICNMIGLKKSALSERIKSL